MSGGRPGTQTDLDHAVFQAERGAPGSAMLVEEALFWLDRRLGNATTEARAGLTAQRRRLTEAAKRGGVLAPPIAETATGGARPEVQDFRDVGLSETDAVSAEMGLREGRYVSFEDAVWSKSIFEATSAKSAPDQAKVREKARRFAGAAPVAESAHPTTSPWGRELKESGR